MKVCFLSYSNCTHALHWAELLWKQGVEVHYLSFEETRAFEGVHFHHIRPLCPQLYLKFILNRGKIKKILDEINPDIVHGFYLTNYAFLATLSGFKRVVVTVQGSDLFLEPRKSAFFTWVNRYVLNHASLVHSVANHMTTRLMAYGLPREKIIIFPEGVDRKIFKSNSNLNRNRARERKRIISTRNFEPVYNLGVLIEAIPYVLEKSSQVQFTLIGDGPERETLIQKAKTIGVDDYIEFPGRISRCEVSDHLSSSDIYVTTSISDGTSASLLEAMSCGVFPVVSDIPANREWIEDGVTGLLFPMDDPLKLAEAIQRALEDRSLREAGIDRNKDIIINRADVTQIIQELIHSYERLAV